MDLTILQDYHKFTKPHFNNFLTDVDNGIYGHTAEFATPSITKAIYEGYVKSYRDTNLAFETGGRAFKPAYEIATTTMMEGLDNLRLYLLGLPNLTYNLIVLSGYHPNKQSKSNSVIPNQPILKTVTRPGGPILIFEFNPVDGAEYYGTILVEGGTLPEDFIFNHGILDLPTGIKGRILHNFNASRNSTFSGLKLNTLYTVYGYCGNSAGVSILSEGIPVTCSNR